MEDMEEENPSPLVPDAGRALLTAAKAEAAEKA